MKQYKLLVKLLGYEPGHIFSEDELSNAATVFDSYQDSFIGILISEEIIEEIKEEKKGRCLTEPEKGEIVWMLDFSYVSPYTNEIEYDRSQFRGQYALGFLFWNEESCQKEIKRMQVMQQLRVLAGGFEPDWSNRFQSKHSTYYSYYNSGWRKDCNYTMQEIGGIYFETAEARDNAIKTLGSELDILKD